MCAHAPLCLILRAQFLGSAVHNWVGGAVYTVWHVVYQYPSLCLGQTSLIKFPQSTRTVNLFGTNILKYINKIYCAKS